MKKVFTLVVAIMFVFAACGGSDGQTVGEKGSDNSGSTSGVAFENNFFKATIASGWEVWDDKADEMGLMRIRIKGDTGMRETIYLKFEGRKGMGNFDCSNDPLADMEGLANDRKGSTPVKVTYDGIEFYKTTFDYGGEQTMMKGKKDGTCITITLAGGDISNPVIQEILNTLRFKLGT